MPMRYTPTASEVDLAARATVEGLKKLSLNCCLVGSVACYAYGMSRTPADVDMLVLTTPTSGSNSVADLQKTQEQLKTRLVALDPRFYTVASKDPYATYRVLWFRLPTSVYSYGYGSCKVDLLLPGIMNIPFVPKERIYRVRDEGKNYLSSQSLGYSSSYSSSSYSSSYGSRSQSSSNSDPLPLMPFLPLLLLKLQAWQDHGESIKLYMRQKQPTDVRDITELLTLAVKKYCSDSTTSSTGQTRTTTIEQAQRTSESKSTLLEKEESWIPESFITAGKTRVKKFIGMYPSTKSQWKRIGFDVDGDAKRGYGAVKSSTDGKLPVARRNPTRKTGYGTRLTGVDDEIAKLQGLMKSLNVEDLDYL